MINMKKVPRKKNILFASNNYVNSKEHQTLLAKELSYEYKTGSELQTS